MRRSLLGFPLLALVLTACPSSNPAGSGSISGVVIAPGAIQNGAAGLGINPALRNDLNAHRGEEIVPGEVIVKFKPTVSLQSASSLRVNGQTLSLVRPLALERTQLYRASGLDTAGTLALVERLAARADVEYAVPNRIWRALKTPNDPYYGAQWHYPLMNLPAAWDTTTGSASTKVAVIDTGILPHPDLAGRVTGGYDFISDPAVAGDGDGRDSDPTDEGDAEQAGEPNSYHGTHVAGTVGAATDNNQGVAGVNWAAKIVPIRVLGRGGGTTADIVEAIRWAAGGSVSGVPANPNRADVINLSLGGQGSCDPAWQEAINFATSQGAIVVVAAGNSNTDASGFTPASCQKVITVGAVGPDGKRAPYSNYGPRIDVMAAGGDLNQTFTFNGRSYPAGVLSTLRDDANQKWVYAFYQGTSMAAPHVAGIVSLMKAQAPSLTFDQALQKLRTSATPLTASQCNRPSGSDCGAGLVDAAKALTSGSTPAPPPPPSTRPVTTYVVAFFCTTRSCLDAGGDLAIDFSRSKLNVVLQTQERTPYSIGGLEPGTYLAAAFQDINGNGEYDSEPLGAYPNPVRVANGNVPNIDIQLLPYSASGAWAQSGFPREQVARLIEQKLR
ncbi:MULTISPECIES: S8 family serine peptidase [unclassified Meiothermus]|uniref:S8 family serine peptidase n=1 Tax=unclassified Meiothermus TaxID=370471 RepID=UPI000D7C6DF3|nr:MULTISPECIES: S8 family serine peptidase [unclassified Meiothermus]PZA08568.1 subtilisin-like serine protease [Meiothermus sp. Pnk-1]RYM40815.1 subtilisin-like serine protease [Meiothermus sp. PNK-Is4]